MAEVETLLFLCILFFCLKFRPVGLAGVGGPLKDGLAKIGKTLPEGPGLLSPSLAERAGVVASGDTGRDGSTRPSGVGVVAGADCEALRSVSSGRGTKEAMLKVVVSVK